MHLQGEVVDRQRQGPPTHRSGVLLTAPSLWTSSQPSVNDTGFCLDQHRPIASDFSEKGPQSQESMNDCIRLRWYAGILNPFNCFAISASECLWRFLLYPIHILLPQSSKAPKVYFSLFSTFVFMLPPTPPIWCSPHAPNRVWKHKDPFFLASRFAVQRPVGYTLRRQRLSCRLSFRTAQIAGLLRNADLLFHRSTTSPVTIMIPRSL